MWYWGGVIAGIVVPCIIQVLLLYRYYFKPRFSKPLPPLIKPIDLKKTQEEIRVRIALLFVFNLIYFILFV